MRQRARAPPGNSRGTRREDFSEARGGADRKASPKGFRQPLAPPGASSLLRMRTGPQDAPASLNDRAGDACAKSRSRRIESARRKVCRLAQSPGALRPRRSARRSASCTGARLRPRAATASIAGICRVGKRSVAVRITSNRRLHLTRGEPTEPATRCRRGICATPDPTMMRVLPIP